MANSFNEHLGLILCGCCSEAAQVDGRKWKITEGTVSKEGVCSVTGDQLQSLELSPELTSELLAKVIAVVVYVNAGEWAAVLKSPNSELRSDRLIISAA